MNHLICKHCPNLTNCYGDEDECIRHMTIRDYIIETITKGLPELHKCFTEAEEEMNEND